MALLEVEETTMMTTTVDLQITTDQIIIHIMLLPHHPQTIMKTQRIHHD